MARNLAATVLSTLILASCSRTGPATAESMTSSPSNRSDPPAHVGTDPGHAGQGTPLLAAGGHQLAAFAEGCFWGCEDTFRHVAGDTATAVGYTGGHTKNPTYGGAIFTVSAEQERLARASVAAEQKSYAKPIATEIRPIGDFYKAEDYHQQYDEKTGRHSCPLPPRKNAPGDGV